MVITGTIYLGAPFISTTSFHGANYFLEVWVYKLFGLLDVELYKNGIIVELVICLCFFHLKKRGIQLIHVALVKCTSFTFMAA